MRCPLDCWKEKEKEKTAMVGEDRMRDRSARCREGSRSEGHEKKPLPWFLFFCCQDSSLPVTLTQFLYNS